MLASYWTPLAVFALLLVCAGLWYGARGVKRQRRAPTWAAGMDRHRGLFVAALVIAVAVLVAFAAVALLAPWFESL